MKRKVKIWFPVWSTFEDTIEIDIPEGEDPDSYAAKVGKQGFLNYLEGQSADLIQFKARLLLSDAGSDPVKKAEAVRSVVESVAFIPDPIKRTAFVQKTSVELQMPEDLLYEEVNKQIARNKGISQRERRYLEKQKAPQRHTDQIKDSKSRRSDDYQESDIIRLLLNYGDVEISEGLSVAAYLVSEFTGIAWDRSDLAKVFEIF